MEYDAAVAEAISIASDDHRCRSQGRYGILVVCSLPRERAKRRLEWKQNRAKREAQAKALQVRSWF